MANKRIELEQYKHYIDLLQEEPNRKRWRQGVQAALVTAMLLALLFFVLGMMSGSQAGNPRNILQAPASPAPSSMETPGDTTTIPVNTIPGSGPGSGEQAPSPEATPVPDQGKAPVSDSLSLASGALDGSLLAQAETVPQEEPETREQTAPQDQAGTAPRFDQGAGGQTAPGGQAEPERSGPDEQTTGVGNLANLANGAGGRGLQLYLLGMLLGLVTLLYLPIRKARMEGRPK